MKKVIYLFAITLLASCQTQSDSIKIEELEKKLNQQAEQIDSLNQSLYDSENEEDIEGEFTNVENKRYCNGRFQFCIDYPSHFVPHGEADNGDGQRFFSKIADVMIGAWGMLLLEEFDFDYYYREDLADNNVTYKRKGNNYYIVSGINSGTIFYRKVITKKINYLGYENTDVIIVYEITYPERSKDTYNEYCKKISEFQ